MTEFHSEDGTLLPAPIKRVVHRHSATSARDQSIECTVLEIVHEIWNSNGTRMGKPRFMLLSAQANDERWNGVAADFLTALVVERLGEGWEIISLTGNSASLRAR